VKETGHGTRWTFLWLAVVISESDKGGGAVGEQPGKNAAPLCERADSNRVRDVSQW